VFEESEKLGFRERERERGSSLLVALGFRERDTGPVGCGGLLGRERERERRERGQSLCFLFFLNE